MSNPVDPNASKNPQKKKRRLSDFVRVLILLLCIGVFSFSAYEILETLLSYRAGRKFYDSTADRYVTEAEVPEEAPPADFSDIPWTGESETEADPDSPLEILKHSSAPISVDFEQLLAENSDVVAWIYSPDTVINYPIVQSKDNEYYLHLRLDRTYSGSGTIFMDFRCEPDFTSDNSLIYGHNMRDGSMFHSLRDYSEEGYFEAHPILYLLTPTQNYAIRLFFGGIVSSTSWPYNVIFADEAERSNFLKQAASTSDFQADFEPEENELLITLSTCSYEFNDARYVVIGTLVPIQ